MMMTMLPSFLPKMHGTARADTRPWECTARQKGIIEIVSILESVDLTSVLRQID